MFIYDSFRYLNPGISLIVIKPVMEIACVRAYNDASTSGRLEILRGICTITISISITISIKNNKRRYCLSACCLLFLGSFSVVFNIH